jgi:hypothetical protein
MNLGRYGCGFVRILRKRDCRTSLDFMFGIGRAVVKFYVIDFWTLSEGFRPRHEANQAFNPKVV